MKLFSIAIFTALAAKLAVATAPAFSTFNENDIRHFLKDRKVEVDPKLSGEALSRRAEEEFDKLRNEYKNRQFTVNVVDDNSQSILNLATDPNADLSTIFPHNWDYLSNKDSEVQPSGDYYSQVKNWVFESWPVENLQSYLKANDVKISTKKSSRQDLIDLAKEHWDEVTTKFNVSGKYAGDWLYAGWSVDDVKKWLVEHDLEFDPNASKDQLLESVKNNNYIASLSSVDNKQALLDSLNLPSQQIFDSAGKIKSDFVDAWSYSQLREWLYIHGLIETKPDVQVDNLDTAKLRKLAKSHENYLVADIKGWLDSAKEHADPYLSKKPDTWKNKLDNFVNSSFLVGIDNWSKDRLKEFLKVRNVKFSQFSTKRQLIELVKSSKDIPVKVNQEIGLPPNWFFESWSTDAIRNWLQEKGENIDGSRQDLIKSVSDYYNNLQTDTSKSFQQQIKYYKPDLDEYKRSLLESLEKTKEQAGKTNSIADDTILTAYSLGLEHYNQAAKVLSEKYNSNKFEFADALEQAQKASVDYSQKLIADSKDLKSKQQENLEAAASAATVFAGELSNKLAESYQQSKSVGADFYDNAQNYVRYLGGVLSSHFYHHKPRAEKAAQEAYASAASVANEASESAKAYADSAQKLANEKYADVKPHVDAYADAAAERYGEYKPKVVDAYNEANKKAQEAYENANVAAQSAYAEYQPVVESGYNDLSEAAQSAYGEYKPVVQSAAKVTYESAKKYGSQANQVVQQTYSEYKPKIQKAGKNSWDYILDVWSNVDLKNYLQSFGFDREFLNHLSRGQLVKLSQEQSDVFYGGSKSKWDKSIAEIVSDTSNGFQERVGLKSKPQTFWESIKSYF